MKRFAVGAAAGVITATLLAHASLSRAESPEPKPAFPGQTDAPAPARPSPALKVDTIATGLNGWALAFLPDGRFLVTARGEMRIVNQDGSRSEPLKGLPV